MVKAGYTTGQFGTCQSSRRRIVLSRAELCKSSQTLQDQRILLRSGDGGCCDFLQGKYSSALRVCTVQMNLGGQWRISACCFLAGYAHGFMANFWSELNPVREVNNWTCQIITISKSNCALFLQRGILNQWAILLDSCSCNKNMC